MSIIDQFKLDNKIAVVTGASKGIGKAIAKALGEQGAKVVVSSRKQEAVDAVAAEFKAAGIDVSGIAAHMGDMEQVKNLVDRTIETYGGIDIIVNNAATNPIYGPTVTADTAVFDKIMDVNVKGPFEFAKLAYPSMKSRGGGSIINISSVEGLSPGMGLGLYSVSKSALIMLTKVMAKEMGADNIRVNVICPGLVDTKFSEALTSNEKLLGHLMAVQPIKRVAQPEDMAGLALFLASDASSYVTGAVYTNDGGYTI